MPKFRLAFVSSVVSLLAMTGSALAQEPAAAEPATPPPAADPAAPAAAPADAPAATAEVSASTEGTPSSVPSGNAVAQAPGAAPATEDEVFPPGWFRIDSDGLGLQLWAGATHSLGGVDIASDIYVGTTGGLSYGEFDIGPAFTVADGALIITPMIGIAFSWNEKKASSLVPQLYLVGSGGPLYFESWWQMFVNKVFTDDALNSLYSRHFVTFALSEHIAIGPEIEPTFGMGDGQDTVTSLPLGGVMKLHYGKDNTLFTFLGYEMIEDARQVATGEVDADGNDVTEERALVGRLSFVKNW